VIAKSHPEGGIDLSVGTPVDDVPEFIQAALRGSSNTPGYPLTIGSPQLREAMRQWAEQVLGVTGEFDLLPTIGSKELIALLPSFLETKRVLYPEIAYPTYLVGALIAHAVAQPVGLDPTTWPDADLVWTNSPSNPTGRIAPRSELQAAIDYSRRTGAIVASDECYINFPAKEESGAQPLSILNVAAGDNRGLLAVHSLSKRSNLAGYRAGLIVGDPELINRIREIRKHAGQLLPAPVQAAMTVALGDEEHVIEQAKRYARRRAVLAPALEAIRFRIDHTEAGLYIWCTRDESDMSSVEALAQLGVLVTPGHFYGAAGARHIRVALTASDNAIAQAAQRLRSSVK
jgi:succinyldiaminopimelate transaminase